MPEDARREPPYAGLLAAGQDLGPARLHEAYGKGIFPWFGEDEPVLWWSPDPRMVLRTETFRLHASLRKRIQRGIREGRLQICVDQDFERIIEHCANQPRIGQASTWIVPPMVEAYKAFHAQGFEDGLCDRLACFGAEAAHAPFAIVARQRCQIHEADGFA